LDNELFTRIVNKYGDKIYTVALHTVQNEVAAEDITQEVFIKIYKNYGSFRGDAKMSTWIYRITKNTCFNYLKREKKYREMDDIETMPSLGENKTVEKEMEKVYRHMDLHRAIGGLSPNLRLAISLYYFNSHSYEEVAAIMDIPLNTLKSHIYRAKKELAKRLELK